MPQKTFGQALNEALTIAMKNDETVFLAGEGVGVSIHQDPNAATHGLLEKFGPQRVKDKALVLLDKASLLVTTILCSCNILTIISNALGLLAIGIPLISLLEGNCLNINSNSSVSSSYLKLCLNKSSSGNSFKS